MALRPAHLVAAVIALAVAFGAAFALGKATADDEPTKAATASAQRVAVPSATGVKVKLEPAGSLPGLRPAETSPGTASNTDSAGPTTSEAAPTPVTPTPTPVTPTAPSAPSTPEPETPISGGDE